MIPKERQKHNRLLNTYGITLEEWNQLLERQEGVCAACQTLPPSGTLCVDHIHVLGFKKMEIKEKKKYIRGLVCFLCNTSFKNFEKSKKGYVNRNRLQGVFNYFQM